MSSQSAAALVAGSPFAERLDRGAPLIVAAGRPARVEFATPAALALFGVETLGALDAVALAAQSPGARRLRHLVEALAPGGPPRMESLRFYAGRLPLPVGLMCARIASSQGRDFLVMATPPNAGEAESPALAVAEPAAGEASRIEIPSARRFLWSLDADDRFGAADRALEEDRRLSRAQARRIAGRAARPRRPRPHGRSGAGDRGAPDLFGAAARLARTRSRERANRVDFRDADLRQGTALRGIPRVWPLHRRNDSLRGRRADAGRDFAARRRSARGAGRAVDA